MAENSDVKIQLPIDEEGGDLQGAVACRLKNLQSPPQPPKELESLNNALLRLVPIFYHFKTADFHPN